MCVLGRPLSISQDDIGINGWAVECRVYAEVRERKSGFIGRDRVQLRGDGVHGRK